MAGFWGQARESYTLVSFFSYKNELFVLSTDGFQHTNSYFYSLKIFHLFGFPSWKSSDPKIIGIKTDLFENFSQKKGSRKF